MAWQRLPLDVVLELNKKQLHGDWALYAAVLTFGPGDEGH